MDADNFFLIADRTTRMPLYPFAGRPKVQRIGQHIDNPAKAKLNLREGVAHAYILAKLAFLKIAF